MGKPQPFVWIVFPVVGDCWFDARGFWQRRGILRLRHCAIDTFGVRGVQLLGGVFGTVTDKGESPKGGYWIRYSGPHGYVIYRAHMDAPSPLPIGAPVTPLTVVGTLGRSGNARTTRCHDHCQVKLGRAFVDHGPALLAAFHRDGKVMVASRCTKDPGHCTCQAAP